MMLSLLNAHALPAGAASLVLAMGLFCGCITQFVAGVLEYKGGNNFGGLAFCAFSVFWASFCFGKFFLAMGWAKTPDDKREIAAGAAAFLFVWATFTFCMFIGTIRLKLNYVMRVLFGLLDVVLVLLGIGDIIAAASAVDTNKKAILAFQMMGGIIGIIVGIIALYLAMAELLKLPTFPAQVPHKAPADAEEAPKEAEKAPLLPPASHTT
eukprot:TRINITY_DN2850_c0_g1_i6.p2 TRINITY_DN2850_c0_g1~~TRINITY_DN2850_c0_g1_i6.p2  ORF type:complete len:210 (-),score=56.76 TRINITY_DN2850_c0_g1_i6:97-726(-)